MLIVHYLAQTAQDLILAAPADPTTTPEPDGPAIVDTPGIISWLARMIVPILLALLGLWILSRAKQGETSRVVTTSGIAIVGLMFIGGAPIMAFLGDDIFNLIFGSK